MSYPQPSNAVDLAFTTPASSGAPTGVNLTFGATAGGPGALVNITLQGRFKLRMSATVGFDASVFRGLVASTALAHGTAAAAQRPTAASWEPSRRGHMHCGARHQTAEASVHRSAAVWTKPRVAHRQPNVGWHAARPAGCAALTSWGLAASAPGCTVTLWSAAGLPTGTAAAARFGLAKPAPHRAVALWQAALAMQRVVNSGMGQAAKALAPRTTATWAVGLALSGRGGPRFLPLPAPVVLPRQDTVQELRFCALYPGGGQSSLALVFGLNPCGGFTPDAPIYILPARFYMAVHTVEAHLLPGLTPLPIYDVSLQADAGSFAWGFSARGPAALFDALAPSAGVPAQIRITLDGMQWVFIVDSLQRQHEFGKAGARIAGRSATAAVGAPYSRELARLNATAQNAQQLAAAALNLTGVGLDWGIADWLVPAGAWSHSGTPLAAVQAIAEAAGGYVNSHRSAPTLLVRHPYPTLPGGVPGGPWNWGGAFAADVELAPDSIITSSIERRDGPDLDGIYVSGTNQGVLALVRRTGTTGSKLAAMVTDPLITANAAAQQRGLSVLGQSGPKHIVQLSMPILTGGANPGVLDVGQLVQINESVPWRGRVRSVGVQASMPTARQQITLERHL